MTAKPTWYERGAAFGKGRLCVVTCHLCDSSTSERAGHITDDMLRKKFMRRGWFIGKKPNQHLCPKHAKAPEQRGPQINSIEVLDRKPLSPYDRLKAAWIEASEDERVKFMLSLRQNGKPVFVKDEPAPIIEPSPPLRLDGRPENAAPTIGSIIPPNEEDEEIADIIFGKRGCGK